MLSVTNKKFLISSCKTCRSFSFTKCFYSQEIENKYSEAQKQKILQIVNDGDLDILSRYDVAKTRLKKLSEWVNKYGKLNKISDLETIDGFTEKTVKKFYNSIIDGAPKNLSHKIKGRILHPILTETVKQNCRLVLSVYVTVNCVCWTLIDRDKYAVAEWKYHGIEYPDSKRFPITDILGIAWQITNNLPNADIYVMKAEATSLRAGGSDPNNPKVIAFNIQKAQMIAIIVALINAKHNNINVCPTKEEPVSNLNQRVYFLRSSLPYRLYGTLVGNERVSTDQTVEMLLDKAKEIHSDNSHVHVPDNLTSMYRSQKELQKDMLGHCLLLAITFMDLCIYTNEEKIRKLTRLGD
ncbi:unnamed protein product [Parnassius apollo]|uniref:(apollo) hypothetical protein n=1 Tax=Parnassius apollo TaxID=110799 RepID=A0A8S3W9G2_PARAO|nr:unnamed protein product [Parnassius apollo]